MLLSVIVAAFFLLLHIAGFSFEDNFQRDALAVIGDFTNPEFPFSLNFIGGIAGYVIFIVIASLIFYFFNKKSKDHK